MALNTALKRPHRCYGKCAGTCSSCGKTVHRGPKSALEIVCHECRGRRPGYQNRTFRRWIAEERTCLICQASFTQQRPGQRYCTLACRNQRPRKPKSEAARERDRKRIRPARTCPGCGEQYRPTGGKQKRCSRQCGRPTKPEVWPSSKVYYFTCSICESTKAGRRKYQQVCGAECKREASRRYMNAHYQRYKPRVLAAAHRRHALLKELEAEHIDPLTIYERDKWTCQLCGQKVRRISRHKHDPRSASLDHVVPVSHGGGTTYANLQCTHLGCNKSKGNRGDAQQLRLI
jgi:hypothetical protein